MSGRTSYSLNRIGALLIWVFHMTLAWTSIGWAQQAGDATVVDAPPQPVEVHASRAPLTHRLKRGYAQTSFALSITLPEVARAQQATQTDAATEPHRPLQIGFGRVMPIAYRGDLAPRLTWEPQSDGTVVSAFSVSSPDALALRVAVRAMLPEGAELRFFGPGDSEQRFPPAARRDFPRPSDVISPEVEAGTFERSMSPALWSPVVEGDTLGVEVSLPSATAATGLSLFIDRVSHLTASARRAEPQRLAAIGNAASCQIDVACDTDHRHLGNPTAKMIFTEPDGSTGLCTGTLMNAWDGSRWSSNGYFLTARHCISTPAVARTLNTYWFFERDECRGSTPTRVVQRSSGADVLATDPRTDSTLLRLRDDPPYGIWAAVAFGSSITHPAEVVGIHHPQGDIKKVSRGRTIGYERILLDGQQVETIKVEWNEGTTEPGSSGSGLFDENGYLIGILSGTPTGQSACGMNRPASYGRFDLFYPHVRRWLEPDSEESLSTEPPDGLALEGLITPADPTTFQNVTAAGRGSREVWDGRVRDFVTINAYLFTARFTDGLTTEVRVNPAIGSMSAAEDAANTYARVLGQLPFVLRAGVESLTIHDCCHDAAYGGSGSITHYVTEYPSMYPYDHSEEVMLHEGVHAALDYTLWHTDTSDYPIIQEADGTFITDYARENPGSEDLAESFPPWLAVRYRPDRISREDYQKIMHAIPNRLTWLDAHAQTFNMSPFTGKPAVEPDLPIEHGNTRGQATPIEPEATASGALERAGDVDYFRVEIAEAGSLTVETIGITNTVGYLQGAQGRYLTGDDNGGAGYNFRIVHQVRAGTYYVAVVGAHRRTVTGPYTLAARFTAGGRMVEHGNTRAQATRVVLNTTAAGVLERAGDVDYFRVEVTAAGSLTVETTGTADTFGYIGNAEGRWLSQNDDAGEGDNFRIVQQVTPGTYYVAVVGGNGRRATGAYSLAVRFPTGGQSADDHGNTREQATHVGLNTDTAGALEQPGDVDYFRVEAAQTGYLTVETSGNTDTVGYFGSADGRWLTQSDDTDDDLNFRIVRHVAAGAYYVAVRGWPGLTRAGSYTFHARFTPSRGSDDHGNTLERATRIGPNSTTAGGIEQPGDVDYFRVTLPQSGTLTVGTTGDTDTHGYLRGVNGVILGENDQADEENDNFQIVRQMAAGTYYVAVQGRDRFTIGPYTLGVRFTARTGEPPADDHANTLLRATPVGLNSTIAGTLEQAGDVDYFQVEVHQVGMLRVEATGNEYLVTVLRSIREAYLEYSYYEPVSRRTTPGTYYVAVYHADRYTTGSYTLRVSFTADAGTSFGDDHGNTPGRGTPIGPDSTTTGNLERADDIDYFRIDVTQVGTVTLETTESTFNVLYGMNGEYLGDGVGTHKILLQTIPGTYYIAVQGAYFRRTGPYTLKASFAATPDDDHGNTPEGATRIELNSNTTGNLEQAGDRDYFQVAVTQAGNLTIETAGETPNWYLLYDERGRYLKYSSRYPEDPITRKVTAGTYYVTVQGGVYGATGPYTLKVSFTPD